MTDPTATPGFTNPLHLSEASLRIFGWLNSQPMVAALMLLIVIDVVTGILAAFIAKRISSTASWRGMMKKVMMLLTIGFGAVLEPFANGIPLSKAISLAFIATESFSILENIVMSGVPVPGVLVEALAKLRAAETPSLLTPDRLRVEGELAVAPTHPPDNDTANPLKTKPTRKKDTKMKTVIPILLVLSLFTASCETTSDGRKQLTPQGKAFVVSAEALANVAGTAAATYYGGPAAGQLASSGLSALGSVLQGYVGTTVPPQVVAATPGVAGVGEAVLTAVNTQAVVTQADVNTVNKAAAIAGKVQVKAPKKVKTSGVHELAAKDFVYNGFNRIFKTRPVHDAEHVHSESGSAFEFPSHRVESATLHDYRRAGGEDQFAISKSARIEVLPVHFDYFASEIVFCDNSSLVVHQEQS